MAFRHLNELPLGDKVFRIELASEDDREVTLTLNGWREGAAATPFASGLAPAAGRGRREPADRAQPALRALAIVADVAEPIPDRDVLRELYPGHGAPWVPQHEEELVRRFHAGETIARIAARYGRTPDSVRTKLRELGHDPRRPEHCPPDGCLSWSRFASPALLGSAAPAE
ncbi:hypothetical protein ACFQ1I_29755 [Kitasatospora arboriphila]